MGVARTDCRPYLACDTCSDSTAAPSPHTSSLYLCVTAVSDSRMSGDEKMVDAVAKTTAKAKSTAKGTSVSREKWKSVPKTKADEVNTKQAQSQDPHTTLPEDFDNGLRATLLTDFREEVPLEIQSGCFPFDVAYVAKVGNRQCDNSPLKVSSHCGAFLVDACSLRVCYFTPTVLPDSKVMADSKVKAEKWTLGIAVWQRGDFNAKTTNTINALLWSGQMWPPSTATCRHALANNAKVKLLRLTTTTFGTSFPASVWRKTKVTDVTGTDHIVIFIVEDVADTAVVHSDSWRRFDYEGEDSMTEFLCASRCLIRSNDAGHPREGSKQTYLFGRSSQGAMCGLDWSSSGNGLVIHNKALA